MAGLLDYLNKSKIAKERVSRNVETSLSDLLKKKEEVCKLPRDNKEINTNLKNNFKTNETNTNTGNPKILMNYVSRIDDKQNTTNIDNFFFSQFDTSEVILDKKWMQNRFLSPDINLEEYNQGRYFTSSIYKYTDTSLGGHLACNTKHQFTRYADIRHPKQYMLTSDIPKVSNTTQNYGMGRYYSEAIDDNAQLVYLQFGVPEFNGILDFLFNSIDYKESVLANTGRKPTLYNIGKSIGSVVGFGVLFACFPWFTVAWLGTSFLVKALRDRTAFNYYYMQPTMYTYWGTVNTILNQIATELRVVKPVLTLNKSGTDDPKVVGTPVEQIHNEDTEEALRVMLGDMYDPKTGYLSAFKIASAPQSKFIAYRQLREKRMEENKSYIPIIDQYGRIVIGNPKNYKTNPSDTELPSLSGSYTDFQDFLNRKIVNGPMAQKQFAKDGFKMPENTSQDGGTPESANEAAQANNALNSQVENDLKSFGEDKEKMTSDPNGFILSNTNTDEKISWFQAIADSTKSALEDGGSYAIFQVEYTGSVSESFSNSTGEINTGGIIKSLAGKTRDLKFDLSGGNLGFGLDIGNFLGYAKDTVAGFLDGVTLGLSSVITTVLGDAYTTIPKKWNDSDMSLPQVSYTMKLRTPYGNTFSQLGSIYLPLSMLLAGVLPLASGRSSYTSPFLCSLYCQGVQNIKLGMITNVSITRGTSKLGFNKSKRPMGVDVSFTVTDFSELMAAPVNTSIFDQFKISYMDDSTFGRYLTTLCARDMNTNKYVKNKLSNILNRFKSLWSEVKDPSLYGYYIGDTLNGIASPFTQQGNFNISTLGNKSF